MFSEKLVIQEDVSRRDEFVKHFYCTDGTFVAIYYPEAVHYEKDGVWYDANNTISFDSKTGRYKTENTDFAASFASSNIGDVKIGKKTIKNIQNKFNNDNLMLSDNHFHGKMTHRQVVMEKVVDLLGK